MSEASLRRVLAVLRARWLLIAALAVPVLVVSWGYAATLPPAHTATVVLSFAPGDGGDAGASFTRLLPRYEITATTQESVERAEQEAGLPSGSLADAVSADLPDDNLELTLTVTTSAGEASAVAARSLAGSVLRAAEEDPLVSVWTARGPESTGSETRERRGIIMVAGLLLMPLPGTALALGLEGSRPRVRLSEDLRGAPVLHAVPLRALQGQAPRGSASADRYEQLWLLLTGALARAQVVHGVPPDVVVLSVDGHDDDAERIVEGVRQAAESVPAHLGHGRTDVTVRAASWPPVVGAAAPAGGALPEQPCVIVLRTGVPQDEAHAGAELVRHQGGRVLGSVLLLTG